MTQVIKPFFLRHTTLDGEPAKIRVYVDSYKNAPVVFINKRVLSKNDYPIGEIIYTYNGYKLYEFSMSFKLTTLNEIMFYINQLIATTALKEL